MDYTEENVSTSANVNLAPASPTRIPSTAEEDEDEMLAPYQEPANNRDSSPSRTPELSNKLPNHIYEDLCNYWRSHSYYQSRIRIFEGFATDGPFPSITSLQFQSDPQTGLTRKFADELEQQTRQYKEKICTIHAKNFAHLATSELEKINALVHEANTIYDHALVQDALKRAREHAFNKARETKRRKHRNRTNNTNNGDKRRRSPSRGRSREKRHRNQR